MTKKIIYLFILFAGITLISCEKKSLTNDNQTEAVVEIDSYLVGGIPEFLPYSTVRKSGNFLIFQNMSDFNLTLNNLRLNNDAADASFLNANSLLSDDALLAKEIQIGYNYNQKLIDYENSLNFVSSRKVVELYENNWLKANMQVSTNAKPNNCILADDVLMTLLNPDYAVIIGDTIYKYYNDGSCLKVGNLDVNTYNAILSGATTAEAQPNAIVMMATIIPFPFIRHFIKDLLVKFK